MLLDCLRVNLISELIFYWLMKYTETDCQWDTNSKPSELLPNSRPLEAQPSYINSDYVV